MQYDGVSFREAVELLKSKSQALYKSGGPVKKSTVPKLPPPVAFDSDDNALFEQVLDYYGERLKANQPAIDYLKKRGLWNEEALQRFRIGYADRTLGLTLPHKNRKDGAEIRTKLTRLGVYRESGHEHFNGSLVFPIMDEGGAVSEIYGRKVGKQKSGINHLYLPGPHRGIWNPDCLKSSDIILTESVIDALTFWVNGFENVTCIYGTEGFTDDHLEAFKTHKTQKVYLAYDRDKAGDRAAERDAERLQSVGIECLRVRFPAGMDANAYAVAAARQSRNGGMTPAAKSLGVLLNSAEWLGKGELSSKTEDSDSNDASCAPSSLVEIAAKELAADARGDEKAAKIKKVELKPVGLSALALAKEGEDYTLELGERSYRVRGLQKNGSLEVLKVNLRLTYGDLFHLDTLDFYRAKDREGFIRVAAEETRLEPELIKRDLGKLLLLLEEVQEARLNTPEEEAAGVVLSAEEEAEAMAFLQAPNLLERISEAFDQAGIVGERSNIIAAYLACTSRLLPKPLAVIIQSTSAAGKSTLMEAVLSFFPPVEQVKYSAMTGQSLYYLGETNLKHKILAIVEEEGAEKASYALKLLQSEGELSIASAGKDPQNGRMQTQEYHVEGPSSIFMTTTSIEIDEELRNRALILTVDESRAQTKRIHELQRLARTPEGILAAEKRKDILRLLQNVQRLLRPRKIANPYAKYLTFTSERTRTRRDHEKYLTLIDTVALLHQYQRPLTRHLIGKREVEMLPVTLDDIEVVNALAPELLGRSLDELPPQTRHLLESIQELVREKMEAEATDQTLTLFSRRQLREFTGWSETQIRVHLERLKSMEYLDRRGGRQGSRCLYELLIDANEAAKTWQVGLLEVEELRKKEL